MIHTLLALTELWLEACCIALAGFVALVCVVFPIVLAVNEVAYSIRRHGRRR